MTKKDRGAFLFLLLFSFFICGHSVVIGLGTLKQPGPGLLSFGAGAGIGVLSLWFLIRPVVSKERQIEAVPDEGTQRKGTLIGICFSLFGYVFALEGLGFLLSTFLFVLLALRLLKPERWVWLIVKGVLITLGNYFIFVEWLGLGLPKGFLPW